MATNAVLGTDCSTGGFPRPPVPGLAGRRPGNTVSRDEPEALFDAAGIRPEEIAPDAFEMLVATWLAHRLATDDPSDLPADLRELAAATRAGRIEVEAAA